jgi:hypothetical protein
MFGLVELQLSECHSLNEHSKIEFVEVDSCREVDRAGHGRQCRSESCTLGAAAVRLKTRSALRYASGRNDYSLYTGS